ncbi:LysM peptidoglycan-binding domain-containing protein [Sporolactobacillus pectinivorans]|uniref:LysM peptidoglycan-binding domain-containing protein n=1 Tax=Sporolactobacillus pectinivorans TaxID=1591408 RepID=UPI0012FD35BC|nr:LysM domain-containing protein [Sporolactobacillus pectinivorans]
MKLYVVQNGDSLAGIAQKNEMAINDFRDMNNGLTDENLVPGMKVKVSGGVQPLKVERSEKPKKPVQTQPLAAAPAQPKKPVTAPTQKVNSVSGAAQGPNVVAGAHEKEKGAPVAPAATVQSPSGSGDYKTIFYPKVSSDPYSAGSAGYFQNTGNILPGQNAQPSVTGPTGQNMQSAPGYTSYPEQTGNIGGNVNPAVMPYYGNPYLPAFSGNPGSAVSPAVQPNHMNPYYNPYTNQAGAVSPSAAPNNGNPYSPISSGYMGNTINPAVQPAAYNPQYPGSPASVTSPAAQSAPSNLYSPAAQNPPVKPGVSAAAMPSATSPTKNVLSGGAQGPGSGKLEPAVMNPAQPYPFLPKGMIQAHQPAVGTYQGGKSVQQSLSPWIGSGKPNGPVAGKMVQNPTGQQNMAGKSKSMSQGTVGGYPYPFMPAMNPQKPCNCGGPGTPYSPFATSPAFGYYGGNQPPTVPYSGMSPVSAPVYQPQAPAKPTGKK